VINVVVESGDAAPATPVGINLPNADWIRQAHGSKSVSLANIVAAYDAVRGGADREFAWDAAEAERAVRHGQLAATLHTDLHEVIGHASGQLDPGVGPLYETLKNYGSTLEEARAALVALYYAVDPKLIELGVMPSIEVGRAEYDYYIRNGLLQQLNRVALGKDIEEDHMRNRQLVAAWVYEQGLPDNVIEKRLRDGKTYFVINDYGKLRRFGGRRELQRIKSAHYAAIRDPRAACEGRSAARRGASALAAPIFRRTQLLARVSSPWSRAAGRRRVAEYPDDFSAQMPNMPTATLRPPELALKIHRDETTCCQRALCLRVRVVQSIRAQAGAATSDLVDRRRHGRSPDHDRPQCLVGYDAVHARRHAGA
jgi:hypothetical protein